MSIGAGQTKRCADCDERKPPSEFYRRGKYLSSYCKSCQLIRNKSWRESVDPNYQLDYDLQRKYGIGLSAYLEISEKQNHVCGICGCSPKPGSRLVVDHCHQTGNIRGLLCFHCNAALGHFFDSPERVHKAEVYLRTSLINTDCLSRSSKPSPKKISLSADFANSLLGEISEL